MISYRCLGWLGLAWLLWPSPLRADDRPHLDALGDSLPAQATHRFGTARLCTQAEVTALTISPDGKLLAAADREGRCYIWEADTGKERLRTAAGAGKRIVFSPNGEWLALGDEFPFEVRSLRSKDPPRLQLGDGPRVFAFSPDSKTLATSQADETDVLLYGLESGKELRRFAGLSEMIAAVAFSPDGKLLAAATAAGAMENEKPGIRVIVWDVMKGEKRREWVYAAKQVHKLVFLPDGKTLIGHFNARLAAWDATTGDRVPMIDHNVGSSFALDDAGKIMASSDGPRVVEFPRGKDLHEFETPALVRHVALSGDGKLLAASPARFETASPRIFLWDLTTGQERSARDGHRHFIDAVAFSHDGRMIATASNVEGAARVWDARSSKLLHTLNLDSLAAKRSGGPHSRRGLLGGLAFSADRPELYVSGQRWGLLKGEPIPIEGEGEGEADDDFRFEQTNSYRAVMTPDARHAASFLSDHAILFWDPAKARTIRKITPDEKSRGDWSAFAFSPDGKLAITGKWFPVRRDGQEIPAEDTIHLWDIAAGKRVKSMRRSIWPVVSVMLSPDGVTLAVIGYPARLELWHLPTGRLLREMVLADLGDMPRTLSLGAVAFAPHGQWLAFTQQEGEILLLETLTGKVIQTLHGHLGFVSSLAFAPDSGRLLSGGRDTTALLWSVVPERPKTPDSWQDADRLWQELGGPVEPAYRVVWALSAHPTRALEVMDKRLQPDEGASDQEIQELVKNLSSARFAQREVAIRRLKQIGVRALPALEQANKKAPDLETKRRIDGLLTTVETTLTPDTLRDLRGLQILEMIATPEARQLLTRIAGGDRGAGKTRMAQAALERLKKGGT